MCLITLHGKVLGCVRIFLSGPAQIVTDFTKQMSVTPTKYHLYVLQTFEVHHHNIKDPRNKMNAEIPEAGVWKQYLQYETKPC